MTVRLTIARPETTFETLEINEPVQLTVGRVTSCNISLTGDALVSRQHALIAVDPPSVKIKDLGSTNGLSINGIPYGGENGRKLTEFMDLRNGDQIKIGKTIIFVGRPGEVDAVNVAVSYGGDKMSSALSAGIPKIPGYRLGKILGSGGMGSVFQATQKSTGRVVAVKTLVPRYSFNERMVTAFTREIEVSKILDHPNIVKFLDSGVAPDNVLFLVLEFVNGGHLAAWMKHYPNKRVPVMDAMPLFLQLADGMAYAHKLNFVHRDIKPHNILMEIVPGGDRPKLTDLGLAKNFEDSGVSGLTASFAGGGTMAYMPPEQLTDFRDVKPSSDVFSLTATFYEMLAGAGPYNFGEKNDMIRVVSACDIVPITARVDNLPPALVAIIEKGLSRRPADRYQDCGEMLEALRGIGY